MRDSNYGTGVSTVGAGGSKNKYQLVPVPTVPPDGAPGSGTNITVMAIESDLYIARSDMLLKHHKAA